MSGLVSGNMVKARTATTARKPMNRHVCSSILCNVCKEKIYRFYLCSKKKMIIQPCITNCFCYFCYYFVFLSLRCAMHPARVSHVFAVRSLRANSYGWCYSYTLRTLLSEWFHCLIFHGSGSDTGSEKLKIFGSIFSGTAGLYFQSYILTIDIVWIHRKEMRKTDVYK